MARSLQPYIDTILKCNGTGASELAKLVDEEEVTKTEASVIRLCVASTKLLDKVTKVDDALSV